MNNQTVSIIDIGVGNLFSIANAFKRLHAIPQLITQPSDIFSSDHLILPGVGSFPHAMEKLYEKNFIECIGEYVQDPQKKLLGICLGFQLLGLSSTEVTATKGLGYIPATVTRLSADPETTVPHIGFNSVRPNLSEQNSFLPYISSDNLDYYFVHSYCFSAQQISNFPPQACYGLTYHGPNSFVSAYHCKNIFGTQFHPEKSQTNGLALFKNFLSF